jgi:Tfp pilus assembly protein PilX
MIGRLLRRVRPGDDRGAILIIAIVVVTVVALVTGFVLTQGDGSLRATVALRDVARASYAADGAAQSAINDLRTGYNVGSGEPSPWYYTNAVGTGCFGYDGAAGGTTPKDTLVLDGLIPKQGTETQSVMSAAVVCTPEDATGDQGSAVPINNGNKPGNAILTLGTSGAENGFTFKTNGSGAAFRVRGGVWSNSNIFRDNNGDLEATTYIRANTGCTPPSAMVAPVVNCSASTAPDPNYQSDLDIAGTGIPALRTPPASCPNNGTVTLQPGYYDDVDKLNALTNTNTDCFIHLAPGTYYFDFHNNSSDPLYDTDIASNVGNLWTIGSRKTLVAGTLTSDTTVPGRCVSPIDDVNANGVQLIFGGDSRMLINASGQASDVEICGSYHANRPPIAIYGQKTGASPALTTLTGTTGALTTSGTPTVANVNGNDATFTPLTAAALQDDGNGISTWQRTNGGVNGNEARRITMGGFAPPATIPTGAVLKTARLVVRHKSAQNNAGTASTIKITPSATGTTALNAFDLNRPGALTTETVDLRSKLGAAQWALFAKGVHDFGYTGASIEYVATVGRNQSAQLDAVRLELEYYVPQLRGQTTTAIPGNTVATVGGAPVIQALGNSTTLYIQGTTYTPLSKIDLSLNNIDESVFRFGVIARSLIVFETGSFDYPGAVIELPDNSPGFGFETNIVQLKVYLCPGVASGCTSGSGELSLTARVKLFDQGGVPGPPNRQISVLSWSHPR